MTATHRGADPVADRVGIDQAMVELAVVVPHPMVIVTASAQGEPAGCLVGHHTAVSDDPPRYLVCLSPKNHTHMVARSSTALGVHFVGEEHGALVSLFGERTGDATDKFSRCTWHRGPDDVPILDDVGTRLVGKVCGVVAFGDHDGFVLAPRVVEIAAPENPLDSRDAAPLDPGHST